MFLWFLSSLCQGWTAQSHVVKLSESEALLCPEPYDCINRYDKFTTGALSHLVALPCMHGLRKPKGKRESKHLGFASTREKKKHKTFGV